MRRRAVGIVEAVTTERPGAQELLVCLETNDSNVEMESPALARRPAINYPALTGPVQPGDRVLLNTVAVELGLGTGGFDFVLAVLDRPLVEDPAPGHVLKLRYTPLQQPVLTAEAPESPYHERLRRFESLDEMPVVCAELHSQIPAICAAAKWALREGSPAFPCRIAYIMTDGAALPLALSRLVPQLKEKGLLDATITAGQAFGGDYEAVNLYSALAVAKEIAGAQIAVVGQGPGNVGTATELGFSGIEQGTAINAADSLGGVPILAARISFADGRHRHIGLSHHTQTALRRIARAPALVPIPRLPEPQRSRLQAALHQANIHQLHQPITVDAEAGLAALEACGLKVTTMGREVAEERPFFLAAAAAGLLAAQLVEARL